MITLNSKVELRLRTIQQLEAGELSEIEACELLGVRPRTVRWLRKQYREEGVSGLIHGNAGHRPVNAYPSELHAEIVAFAKEPRCEGMNQCYLTEILAINKILVSRSTVRRDLVAAGINSPRSKRRRKLYRRRTPRARAGMLLQMDASPHRWIPELPEFSIHTAVEDATRELDGVRRPTEDTWGYFELFKNVAEAHGLPEAIYVDRAGIFGGSTPTRKKLQQELSQFERAMRELGVRVIKARSAQAKGRVEKYNDTLQDRLVSWFKYEGVTTMDRVDAALRKYIVQHKRRFTIAPKQPEAAWRPVPADINLDDVLCLKYTRVVRNDNTIVFKNHTYDLPAGPKNSGLAKQVVHVLQSIDGKLRAAHKGKIIALLEEPGSQIAKGIDNGPQRPLQGQSLHSKSPQTRQKKLVAA